MADLKSLTNIRTTEDLINAVSTLYFNLNELERNYYNMFVNPVPMDIELQRYNDLGVLETITLPNRAKDRQDSLTGKGTPEGVVIAGPGTHYLDLENGTLYYKTSDFSAYGWIVIWSSLSLVKGVDCIPVDGDGSKLKNLNMNNAGSGFLSTTRGGTGTSNLEGLIKGNGSAAFSTAVDGKDYIGPATLTGVICYYPTNRIPNGWLICDGSEYSRNEYSDLFESLKVYGDDGVSFDLPYGAGDGRNTFNVPNLMGDQSDSKNKNSYYVRCWDGKTDFNQVQYDEVKEHSHEFEGVTETEDEHTHDFTMKYYNDYGRGTSGVKSYTFAFDADEEWTGVTSGGSQHSHIFTGETNDNEGSTENRVLSKMLVPIIKY